MRAEFYLVIQGKPGRYRKEVRELGSIRTAKRKPACAADEVALKLSLEIPDTLFVKPTLEASITVPGPAGPVLTAEVEENIAEIIRQQTGMSVHITAAENTADLREAGEAAL